MTQRQTKEFTASNPRFPNITVKLSGYDGNAYSIMGSVSRALRNAGVSNEHCNEFSKECMNGDYDNLFQTCMKWVVCD